MDSPAVKNAFRDWIDRRGLKYQHVARQLQVTKAYMSRLCSANPPYPSREMALRIMKLTDGMVTPTDFALLEGRERKHKHAA